MAYIRGSPREEPRSSETSSEEERPPAESDEDYARRLQAEEQGRPVARFKLMDRVEARYKDPELRGGTWSREYYAATVVDVLPPKTQKRPHSYLIKWDDGSEDQLVLEDYVRLSSAVLWLGCPGSWGLMGATGARGKALCFTKHTRGRDTRSPGEARSFIISSVHPPCVCPCCPSTSQWRHARGRVWA